MTVNSSPDYDFSGKIEKALLFFKSLKKFIYELKEFLNPYWLEAFSKSKTHYKKISSKLTRWDLFWGLVGACAIFTCLLIVFTGFFILGYQTLDWLESGIWKEIPLLLAFNFLFEGAFIHEWVIAPDSWLGLHQIIFWMLENLPLSLVLIVDGTFLTIFSTTVIGIAIFYRYYQLNKI